MQRILVVEDNLEVGDSLVNLLEVEGFVATWAKNGAEALDVLRASPTDFGLILLDVMMPRMDGWQFRRLQLDDAAIAHVPVVMLSADRKAVAATAALELAGALVKPVDTDALLDTVRKYVSP